MLAIRGNRHYTQGMQSIGELLQREYLRIRAKNPSFSKRAFSRKLGISSGALIEIMNGQRKVSKKALATLCGRLGVHPTEDAGHKAEESSRKVLSLDIFESISRIEHFHVLNLLDLDRPPRTAEKIADRLELTPAYVRDVLKRLERLGMVEKNARGGWRRSSPSFDTPDNIRVPAIQQAHRESMSRAEAALRLPIHDREFSLLFHAGSKSQIPLLKKKIREFQDQIHVILDSGPKEDVLQLNIQLFPVTVQE